MKVEKIPSRNESSSFLIIDEAGQRFNVTFNYKYNHDVVIAGLTFLDEPEKKRVLHEPEKERVLQEAMKESKKLRKMATLYEI